MAWFKVDDRLWSHPKWLNLPLEAKALWVSAGSYCAEHESDGFISRQTLAIVLPNSRQTRAATALVKVGLWEQVEGGYRFHNWERYQPSKAQQQAKRQATKERVERWRNAQCNAVSNAVSNGVSNASPDPTRPVPIKETNNYVVSKEKRDRRATTLPDTWQPSETHQAKAFNLGLNCAWEADKFRNHHGAKGTRFKNWDRAFHNWLNHAAEYARRDGGYHAPIGYGTPQPAPPASSDQPRKIPIPDGLTGVERTIYKIEYTSVLDATQNPEIAHDRAMKLLEK